MAFNRTLEEQLYSWKNSTNRKPLVLRGARQVGKTTLIKQFSNSYQYKIFLNLEKKADIRFFEIYDDVNNITEALFLEINISSKSIKDCLLFIDEIQESSNAIQFLRYFYEEVPELHVIASYPSV